MSSAGSPTITREPQPHRPDAPRTNATWAATRLVAEREISTQLRTKGFWITLAVFVVGLLAATILPGLFGGDDRVTVAVAGPAAAEAVAATDFEVEPVTDRAAAEELVRDGEVDGAVIDGPAGPLVIGLADPPTAVVSGLSQSPPVELLEPDEVGGGLRFLVAFAFALAFMMFSFSGMAIAQSVVTEKQTRIVEILVATIPIRAILAGKIIGHSLLVFAQLALLAMVAPIGLRAGDQSQLLSLLAPALGWFLPFFALGFVLLATMWSVAGSIVSRQEDLGSTAAPIIAVVMLPYFGVVFFFENTLVMTILSYVPFSAAVAMPVRLFAGEAQPWEPFVSMLGLVATMIAGVLIGSRLYAGSLLRTGSRVKLRQAWSQRS
ncbi:ABC transporter permease [Natronosporangium hydrolyticum]|uniref:ABC transporter permease n=1 Tax=Natronosporangium hydrolyticum TaxID=2811111 RepID=A0A895Y963_9ACTN|nr:ABC transporter permease [Natronosporangium hydrolyticum]QSB14277.1 ABC transporter permease [Natronosporangium hydrolyticum]